MENTKIQETVLNKIESDSYKPVPKKTLAEMLGIPEKECPAFFAVLKAMEAEGTVYIASSGKVKSMKRAGLWAAKILNLTKTGAFASIGDENGDIFIKKENLHGALPTDRAAVTVTDRRGRSREGEVVKVIERNFTEFTGVYHNDHVTGSGGYITADSGVKDPVRVLENPADAKDGDKVLAKIRDGLTCDIVMSFGSSENAAACCRAVLGRFHARQEFPEEVVAEAAEISGDMKIDEAEIPARLDLRGEIIFTIDGEKTKDIDDAVSVKRDGSGYRLGVHIADVSHYVREGTKLDKEAFLRGTSIYYANRVIPMLPKELSNGICSLNPQEDRLAFSCLMTLDENARMTGYELKKTVIRSRVKGVYDEINEIFDGTAGDEINKKYAEALDTLKVMRELAGKLKQQRIRRGAMEIEGSDCEIILNDKDEIVDIVKRMEGEAETMIEDFMLCANEAVATYACDMTAPLVYRVHTAPEAKKLDDLKAALKAFGIPNTKIKPGIQPRDIAEVVELLKKAGKGPVLSAIVLRSMAKARYSPDCLGHFGLALKYYCHFTSPIRRYPDLCVHRILSDVLANGFSPEIVKRYQGFTQSAAEASSEKEVAAMQIEWGCEDIYKADYLSHHVGEKFEGFISSVRPYGIYVELENTAEGMCRVENIPGGWFDYDENAMALVNSQSGRRFSLGDKVTILVAKADVSTGLVDFVMA